MVECILCSTFYLRRLCNHIGSQFPPINAKQFDRDFDEWKVAVHDTAPVESNAIESSPIELLPNPHNGSSVSVSASDELNVACTDFSEFDTQMSPLIYSDSEDSTSADNETQNVIQNSQTISSQSLTPEIACNQEHAARARHSVKESTSRSTNSRVTPTKRKETEPHEKVSPVSKRLSYKQLPIKISSNGEKVGRKSQTYLFRTRKQICKDSKESNSTASQSSPKPNHRAYIRNVSSTSDVQILSEHVSPITISSSSEYQSQVQNQSTSQKETELNSETNCPSPDLFNSFTSVKSEPTSQKQNASPKSQDKQQDIAETDKFRDVFGAPDECDDIDLLSNKNVDIFEITKNSVFDNVLCSAHDRITPFKSNPNVLPLPNPSPNTSCLSGLRVMLPHFDGHHVSEIQNDLLSQIQTTQGTASADENVIDLTLTDSQKTVDISSEESNRNVEKTPERKQHLTPSTRSCLKPNSSTDKKKRSARLRHGWLSTSRTSPQTDTPQSRRRLDRWRKRITDLQTDDNEKMAKPRNLFNEFKSNSKLSQRLRQRNYPSTSAHESPNIFSDHD